MVRLTYYEKEIAMKIFLNMTLMITGCLFAQGVQAAAFFDDYDHSDDIAISEHTSVLADINRLLKACGYTTDIMKKYGYRMEKSEPEELFKEHKNLFGYWIWPYEPTQGYRDEDDTWHAGEDHLPSTTPTDKKKILANIRNVYVGEKFKDTFSTYNEAIESLQADSDALQSKIDTPIHNEKLRKKLQELLDIVQGLLKQEQNKSVSNQINFLFKRFAPHGGQAVELNVDNKLSTHQANIKDADGKLVPIELYTVNGKPVAESLKDLKIEIDQAMKARNSSLIEQYKVVEKRLKSIQNEVEKMKRMFHTGADEDQDLSSLDVLDELLPAVQKLEKNVKDKLDDEFNSDLNKQKKLTEYKKLQADQKLYEMMVAEIALEINQARKKEKTKSFITKSVNAKISRSTKDIKSVYKKDPNEELQVAKLDLIGLQDDLAELERQYGKSASASNEVQRKKAEIKNQEEYIISLKAEIKKFDAKINKTLGKLVKEADGDKKKALATLLAEHTENVGTLTRVSNFFGSEKSQSDIIKSIENIETKEVAKRLQQQIQDDQSGDSVVIARKKLAKAKAADIPEALQGVINATLAKQGISMSKMSPRSKSELAVLLRSTVDKLSSIENNPKIPDLKKAQRKELIMQDAMPKIMDVISKGLIGVSLTTAQTGSASTIGMEVGINYLLSKFDLPADDSSSNVSSSSVDKESQAYKTLGLEYGATQDELTKAYKTLARKHHPDKGGSKAKFQEIANAYQLLKDIDEEA